MREEEITLTVPTSSALESSSLDAQEETETDELKPFTSDSPGTIFFYLF